MGAPAPAYAYGSDAWLMRQALGVARWGLGTVAPNPSVGAVVFDPVGRIIVGRGVTQPGGRPHAEPVAIANAGAAAQGAVMAVTLEPCSHWGRSPPCVDAVIAGGLSKVIYAIVDPDPRVAGRGVTMLRAAGVTVVGTSPELVAEALWITRGHILRVTERRPFVQVKIAAGRDGLIAAGGAGRPTWVTGHLARAHGHLLRAQSDAILVGTGTVLADDPELSCRLPGLSHRSPARIVVGARRIPAGSRLAATASAIRTLHFDPTAAAQRAGPGEIEIRPTVTVAGRVWLPALMEALVAEGITRLLVEGGPAMWASFAEHRLVDEVVLFQARGSDAGTPVGEAVARATLARYCPGPELALVDRRRIGDDDRFVFRVAQAAGWHARNP